MFLNESFIKHMLGIYSMSSSLRQGYKGSPCPLGVCILEERQASGSTIIVRMGAQQGHPGRAGRPSLRFPKAQRCDMFSL